MKLLIQRVREAEVNVAGECIARIGGGLLAFVGVEKGDDEALLARALHKLLNYRVFADEDGKMNLSLKDTGGGLLLVSQFTLAASTRKGLRPSFSEAAEPEYAQEIFEQLVTLARAEHGQVESGRFAADMQVSLINDGPVTFLLDIA